MINCILLFSILLVIISKVEFYKITGINTYYLVSFFTLKSLVSILVWMYFFYKPGFGPESDMYQFFNVANQLHHQLSFTNEVKLILGLPVSGVSETILSSTQYWSKLHDYGVINDNRIMIRINLWMRFFSSGSYATHSLLFTFLGYNGLIFLVKIARTYVQTHILFIASLLFLSPSGLIWTGNMFKESLILFSVSGVIYFLIQIKQTKKKFLSVLFLLPFLAILIQTKPLFSLLFIYSFISYILVYFLKSRIRFINFFAFFFVPLLLLIVVTSLLPFKKNDDIIRDRGTVDLPLILKNKQDDFLFDVRQFKPQTLLPLNKIDGTYGSVVKTIPYALHNILIAPFETCVTKWEMIPFALEILILGLLFLLSLKFPALNHDDLKDILKMISYPSLLSLLIIGLIVPIEGLLVKYAAPAIVFITWLLALKINWSKVFPLHHS